eukprot:TRINITY_DN1903_c0_g1_i4.p1 TRINITY_DN1903_c0_g1~~TRINITY_DN1903_c0_g1_i4.p1  ORF type:complete len:666 (+),score=89.85 TRINITY_DN1903_c0_g1_i4:40-2037(+)
MGNSNRKKDKRCTYMDGSIYLGKTQKGKRNGIGRYYYANGDRYEGEWKNDKRDGKGIHYYENGDCYVGEWIQDMREGTGTYFFNTGERFNGIWKQDMRNGRGTIFMRGGVRYEGTFVNNKKHGVFIMQERSGACWLEVWDNNKLITRKSDHDKNIQEVSVDVSNPQNPTPGKMRKRGETQLLDQSESLISPSKEQKFCLNSIGTCEGKESKRKLNFSPDLVKWTPEEVAHWFVIAKFPELAPFAMLHQINGQSLLLLNPANDILRETLDGIKLRRLFRMLRKLRRLYGVQREDVRQDMKKSLQPSGSKPTHDSNKGFFEGLNHKGSPDAPKEDQHHMLSHSEEDFSIAYVEESCSNFDKQEVIKRLEENFWDRLLRQKPINRLIVPYSEIEKSKKIGSGGYGAVYIGKWCDDVVAIKEIAQDKQNKDNPIKDDFVKEVNIMYNLRHPQILRLIGVSFTNSKCYMLTEYVENGSLFTVLHQRRVKFTQSQLLQMLEQIASAMLYLHNSQICHCDLKSSNILLDKSFNAKLCDFGLSRIKDEKKNYYKGRVGTPNWMAPEIMREEAYEESADVFSYGMIAWELVTGQIPYKELSAAQIIGSVGFGDKFVDLPTRCNPTIMKIIHTTLSRDKTQRPTFRQIKSYFHEPSLKKDTQRKFSSKQALIFSS